MSRNKVDVKLRGNKESPILTKSPSGVLTRKKSSLVKKNVLKGNVVEVQTQAICVGNKECQTDFNQTNLALTSEFLSKAWLTDQSIAKHTELLNFAFLKESNLYILNPLIVHAVQNLTDYSEYLLPLHLYNKDFILMPLNNSEKLTEEGGSHWSTLVFNKSKKQFFHYDSYGGINTVNAKKVAEKLVQFLIGDNTETEVINIKCPQQGNGYDCGVFTLHMIDLLVSNYLFTKTVDPSSLDNLILSDTDLILKRSVLAYVLNNNYNIPATTLLSLLAFPTVSITKSLKNSDQALPRKQNVDKTMPCFLLSRATQTDPLTKNNLDLPKSKSSTKSLQTSQYDPVQPNKYTQNNFTVKRGNEEIRRTITILSDSHGRKLDQLLQNECDDKTEIKSIIRPGADIDHITKEAQHIERSKNNHVILIAGANNIYSGKVESLCRKLKNLVVSLKPCRVTIASVPFRQDLHLFDQVNEHIMNFNLFINEITHCMKDADFLDLSGYPKRCFEKSGIHLNFLGKRLVTKKILPIIFPHLTKSPFRKDTGTPVINEETNCPKDSLNESIKLIEADMTSKINEFKNDPTVAFSHCISA